MAAPPCNGYQQRRRKRQEQTQHEEPCIARLKTASENKQRIRSKKEPGARPG